MNRTIFRRCDRLVGTELPDGGYVILDPGNSRYYHLNGVGSVIWGFLKTPIAEEEIVESLVRRYDISVQECEQQVADFLQLLMSHHLVGHD